ncbi:hypothetical protein [Limnoglobus roseus]|nr:hypothetical protein [Limnoglobus roseus]
MPRLRSSLSSSTLNGFFAAAGVSVVSALSSISVVASVVVVISKLL